MTLPSDSEATDAGEGTDQDASRPSGEPPAPGTERTFDWRGWFLVGTVAFSFLVVPGALLVLPSVQSFVGSLGLSLRQAYLALPMIPAIVLGAVAVWSAVRSRSA